MSNNNNKKGGKKGLSFFCSSLSLLYAEGYFLIKCSGEQDREIVSVLSSNKAQIERRIKKWEEKEKGMGGRNYALGHHSQKITILISPVIIYRAFIIIKRKGKEKDF